MPAYARIATVFAFMAACVALAASAADRRETRAVSGFAGISLAAPIKVQLTQGDTESLVLEGDEDALAQIETVVEDGTLKIRSRSRSGFAGLGKVKASLGAKNVERLAIGGSAGMAPPAPPARGSSSAPPPSPAARPGPPPAPPPEAPR